MARAGEEFETEFPEASPGKPMRLGDNLKEIEPKEKAKGAKG